MQERIEHSIRIQLNGKMVSVPAGCDMVQLAEHMGFLLDGTAVELNGVVLSAQHYSGTILQDGDCLELVRLVGGG